MAYPTDRTLYWRTDSTSGTQDGTTDTAGNSGTAAFESLEALVAYVVATDADLTGQGVLTLRCTQGGVEANSSWVDLVGITTTASDYLVIECTGDAHHGGVSRENGGTGYQMRRSGEVFRCDTAYCRLKGLEFTSAAATSAPALKQGTALGAGTSDIRLEEIICGRTDATINSAYAMDLDGEATYDLKNVLCIGNGKRGADLRGGTLTADHCGFISANTYAVMIDASVTITNSWAYSTHATPLEEWEDGSQGSGSNNSSIDGTATGTGTVTITAGADEFTSYSADPASADFNLKDSNLNAAGTGSLATDISGAARSGTADIGPYNWASSGGIIPQAKYHYQHNTGSGL
jgi:hypothetical protein